MAGGGGGGLRDAGRLGREFSDELRLLLEDLGWGEGSGESLELRTPPDVLRRVLTRMQASAERQRACEERERAETRLEEEQTQRVVDTCRRVLGELEA